MTLPLVPLLLAAANLAPSLMKFVGAGETAEKVAGDVSQIIATVAGSSVSESERLKVISEDQQLLREFQLRVMQHMSSWDKMFLEDTQNARQRDVELAKAGIKNHRANVLVGSALIIVIVCLFVVVIHSDLHEYAKGTVTLILGRALGWVEQIFSFEFGTTKSSKQKDSTIDKLTGMK